MTVLEAIIKISFATPIVWRLTRMVVTAYEARGRQGFGNAAVLCPEEMLGSRVMDGLYWIGLWMSAQTSVWVVCGFAGVLLNWFALSGIARMARPAAQEAGEAQLCR